MNQHRRWLLLLSTVPELIKVTKGYKQLSSISLVNTLLWINRIICRRQIKASDWLLVVRILKCSFTKYVHSKATLFLNFFSKLGVSICRCCDSFSEMNCRCSSSDLLLESEQSNGVIRYVCMYCSYLSSRPCFKRVSTDRPWPQILASF